MNENEFPCLRTLWWGVCIGGTHYTGEIHIGDRIIELTRSLSRKESKELAEKDGRWWLAAETSTNRFNSSEQLQRVACEWCEKNLGKDWILLSRDAHNPRVPIGARGRYLRLIPKLSRIAIRWDKLSDAQREKQWNKVYNAWKKTLGLT